MECGSILGQFISVAGSVTRLESKKCAPVSHRLAGLTTSVRLHPYFETHPDVWTGSFQSRDSGQKPFLAYVIPTTMGRRNLARRALRWISFSASGHASIASLFRNDVTLDFENALPPTGGWLP